MSGKRQATSDLNHDNWDRDEEPEERGTFRTATEDEIKGRVIKKARRKVGTGTSDAGDGNSFSKSVFSGFSGFGKPAAAAASPFSFLAKLPSSTEAGCSSGGIASSSIAATSSTATFSFGTSSATSTASSIDIPTTKVSFVSSGDTAASTAGERTDSTASTFSFGTTSTTAAKYDATSAKDKSAEYYAKLKGLNQAVSEWIKSHVDQNPLCILTPIFKDYEKYLKELEDEKSKSDTAVTTEKKATTTTTSTAGIDTFKFSEANTKAATTTAAASTFSFSSSTAIPASSAESSAKTNGFSFGLMKPDETKDSKPASTATAGFSFGLKSSTNTTPTAAPTTSTPATGFSFGKSASTSEDGSAPKPFSFTPGATPFSFGNIKPPEAPATTENDDDEDEEAPKNEFKQVVEEDAVYSKKCKVYVKKDGNFVDKGVGALYLKPIESNGKTQLLVRADTNLGNILVNLILSAGLPSQRMGKNNVMLVCLPTPEADKPTPMLLRVKTGEEADELLEVIEKYKK